MTTAATDSADNEAGWSNYGSCVDVWAPGVNIVSTRRGGGTTTMSGTSMAAPHAGGVGALFLSRGNTSAAVVEDNVKGTAVPTTKSSKDGRQIKVVYAGVY